MGYVWKGSTRPAPRSDCGDCHIKLGTLVSGVRSPLLTFLSVVDADLDDGLSSSAGDPAVLLLGCCSSSNLVTETTKSGGTGPFAFVLLEAS